MDIDSIRAFLITLHSVSATVSFFAGSFLMISPVYTSSQRFFSVYWWSLLGMSVLLAGTILVYWVAYSAVERIVFPGLLVLSLYMLYRARRAKRLLQDQQDTWRHDYLEHIGFTLISLFEGFIIVSGLNSGLPGWSVALIAIAGVLLGRWLIGVAQRRVEQEP
jgi:hypothetical protein